MSDTQTHAQEALHKALRSLISAIDAIDAAAPEDATRHLVEARPFDGPEVRGILDLCQQGLAEGWLLPHEAGPSVRFGRLDKDMGGYAVDAVLMADGHGRGHTHTRGEINMCFPVHGEPLFDGHAPGWVVFPPGSHHVPTVTGGTMLFLYFTPGGDVVWDAAPESRRDAE